MPRPKKCRKVCCLPKAIEFTPSGCVSSWPAVILTVDEYETIRLIDKEGFSQEECGEFMQVARATAQQIYTSARSKLAEALVCALPLKIEGGDYRLCDRTERVCRCGGCRRHRSSGPQAESGDGKRGENLSEPAGKPLGHSASAPDRGA